MLFSDADLFGAEQLDLLDLLDEMPTPGSPVRYHGSQQRAHGDGYVVKVDADGRLTIKVHRPDQRDPWYPLGFVLRGVSPQSVTRIDVKAAA